MCDLAGPPCCRAAAELPPSWLRQGFQPLRSGELALGGCPPAQSGGVAEVEPDDWRYDGISCEGDSKPVLLSGQQARLTW